MTKRTKRTYQDTTVPQVEKPLAEIMAALLKTPPPPAGNKSTRQVSKRKQKGGK